MSASPSPDLHDSARSPAEFARMDRRTAVKWMLTAAATMPVFRLRLGADEASAAMPAAKGYGTDPNLLRDYPPGELWPLTLSDRQRATAVRLCDLIIPADRESPSASQVGVVDFIDEWISAPYPDQRRDRTTILEGFAWLDAEAQRRFSCDFASLPEAQAGAICDEICYVPRARPELAPAAAFFARYRNLTAGGFYTTPAGTKDLKFVGNVPMLTFDGPPDAVLRKAGLL